MGGSEAQSGGLVQMGHLGRVGVEGIQGILVGGGGLKEEHGRGRENGKQSTTPALSLMTTTAMMR